MKAIIGGTTYSIKINTFRAEDTIEMRATCSFSIPDKQNEYTFKKGQPVTIIDDKNNDEQIFAGFLETSDKYPLSSRQANAYMHDIVCIDMHYLADKRRISYAARNKLAGDIVKDIVDQKLVEEGVYYSKDLNFVETTTADFSTGTLSNVVAENDSLRLDKTGSDVTDIETTTADFAEGTLTDVVAVNDGLELANNPALSFDGVDDYVIFNSIPTTNTDNITGECIIKPNDVSSTQRIFYLGDSGTNGWGLYIINGNIQILCGGEGFADSGYSVSIDELLKIKIARDSGTWRIWINGVEQSVSGNPIIATPLTDEFTLAGYDNYNGMIDEVRIWEVVNTTYDLNSELTGNETGLVAYYKMNEGSGSTLTDSAGTNDGTISGATWTDNYISWNLDGTGTRQSPQLDSSPAGTIESGTISWVETLNSQTITIQTSTDGGSTWDTCTNGGSIPNLTDSTSTLDVRQMLETTDTTVTPRLESLEVEILSPYETTGYRISKPFDLSPAVEDGGSTISWQETAPTNTSITVETSTDDGQTWDTATNGQPIPNLPTDLQGVELKYKSTLNTTDTSITPTFDEVNIDVLTDNASIEDGTEILETRANFVPTEQLISSVADKMNFWWKIDSDKVLHFKSRDSEPADWQLEPQYIRGLPTAKTGNPLYRNQQLVKGPIGITEEQVDVERGDGDKKAFPVSFPIAEEPTIEISINGGAWQTQTVGRKGVDDGFQWYWEKESDIITHDNAETRLTSNDRVRCTFIGQFKIVAQTYDPNLISKQADIDGTSGIVEDAITVGNVEGREAAIEIGNKKIQKYGVDSKELKFQTRRSGLKAGQLITVRNLDAMDIADGEKLLITKTSTFDENGQIFYDIEAVKGPKHKTWEEFFMELTKRAELVVSEGIGGTEILIIPIDFSKTWTYAENPNIFRQLKADGTWQADGTYTPNFEPNDRVTHIAWFNGDTELGRQERTQQDVNTADRVDTLTYLGPNSANENITHFGWIGGFRATEQVGTGVLIDKQPYDLIKKETEALQISRSDYSWAY